MNLFVSIILTLQFVFYDTLGKVCETESCKRMAGDLNKMIDKTIDPCDDFSSHLCGNMDKAFSIPPGGTDFDATTEINEAVTATMKNLLINQPLKNHSLPQTKAAILYKSCLDMNSRNQYTKPTILKLLKLFKSENSYEDNLIHLLNSGMGSRMISFDVQQNPTNPKYNILNIGKPSLITSLLQADNSNANKELMASYSKFINKILDILGLWKNNRTIIDEIIKLHIRLAKAFPSIADQNDPDKTSNKLTIKELQQRCSQISWLKIINGALKGSGKYMNETDTVMIFSLEYIDTVCKVIEEYKTNPLKKSILDKDLEWMVISHAAPLGSEQLIEANDMFQQDTMETSGKEELWKTCIDITSRTLSEIMGNMYVKAEFDPSQKRDIEFMIQNVKKALKSVIEKVTWMDSETKQAALVKLAAIKSKIGYPESLLAEQDLIKKYAPIEMSTKQFLQNYINYQRFAYAEQMKYIGDKISDDMWIMGSQEVNAYYNPSSNEIVFPAAILRYPFYDIGLPITYNYGAVGTVVGHEILHGFDTSGSKYDSEGMLREWWSKSSKDEYLRKTQCIINQYGNYTLYDKKLPSDQTIGEDIADNAGIRMAFIAVTDESREKLTLPGLNYTAEQLFFVGEARTWCMLITKSAILEKMKGDVHTVWKFRINGPLGNMPEFSKAFNCDRNKEMNRHKKCLVW